MIFGWKEENLHFLGQQSQWKPHLSKECRIGYGSNGGVIHYDLIIAVVEVNQEVTWHQGETSENC